MHVRDSMSCRSGLLGHQRWQELLRLSAGKNNGIIRTAALPSDRPSPLFKKSRRDPHRCLAIIDHFQDPLGSGVCLKCLQSASQVAGSAKGGFHSLCIRPRATWKARGRLWGSEAVLVLVELFDEVAAGLVLGTEVVEEAGEVGVAAATAEEGGGAGEDSEGRAGSRRRDWSRWRSSSG